MTSNTSVSRSIFAAATAGALILGGASGAMAHGRQEGQGAAHSASAKSDRLVSVSIKGHSRIDLADYSTWAEGTGVALQARVHDPKKDGGPTIGVVLGVYTKKVGGYAFQVLGGDAPKSSSTALVVDAGMSKSKTYRATASLKGASAVWTTDQIAALATALRPGEKAFICIADVTTDPTDVKKSVQVKKRLGLGKGKAVRDCVKVVDSTPVS